MKRSKYSFNYKILIGILGFGVFSIFAVVVTFIVWFRKHSISNDISYWASTGDFIGGILGPLISFFSLILLGYLTFIVSKQTIDENVMLNIKLRRLDAYNELTKRISLPQNFISSLKDSIITINGKMDLDNSLTYLPDYYENALKDLSIHKTNISEFNGFMANFKIRYGHLFEFNFESEKSKDFEEIMYQLDSQCREMFICVGLLSSQVNKENLDEYRVNLAKAKHNLAALNETYTKYFKAYNILVIELRKEVTFPLASI